jgi:hypothetical protein
MRRVYVDPSDFRAPFDAPGLMLSGLGESLVQNWKPGRQYLNISNFRAPYDNGYFQNNQLFGLGEFLASVKQEVASTEAAAQAASAPPPSAAESQADAEGKMLGNTLVILGIGLAVGVAAGYGIWKSGKK